MPSPTHFLSKAELVDGEYYRGRCRNSDTARWCYLDERFAVFLYVRHKFGETFYDEIFHPEDEHQMDVFYPFETVVPDDDKRVTDEYLQRVKERVLQYRREKQAKDANPES